MAEQMLRISESFESRTFFLKMIGDYKRYLIEVTRDKEEKKELKKDAKKDYEQATTEAENLFSTHPLRLAAFLNYSVYLAEIELEVATAIEIAKAAFEAALFDIQAIGEDKLNETLRVMQLLKDNYTLWQLDIRVIIKRKRAAGHYIEGQENNSEDEELEDRN
jgi:14-3-3 protein epsilon